MTPEAVKVMTEYLRHTGLRDTQFGNQFQSTDRTVRRLRLNGTLRRSTFEAMAESNPGDALRSAFVAANPNSPYDEYKNKLGNLTMLEKPINIVASNDFFSVKKAEFRKCEYYLTSSIAKIITVGQNTTISRINDKLQAFDDWPAASIDRRHDLLMGLARHVWKAVPLADE
jgi:hypothetical protein